jgi:hypothetical protein
MKKSLCLIAVGLLALATLSAQEKEKVQSKPNGGFDRFKTLVGTWESPSPDGSVTSSTIRLVSNGSAIEEVFQSKSEDQMVTLYSPDGDRLAMTHYCSVGNQPRMETKATAANQGDFEFSYTGGTNIASPNDAHMHHLSVHFIDKDHFDEIWTLSMGGKEQPFTFHFTRKS